MAAGRRGASRPVDGMSPPEARSPPASTPATHSAVPTRPASGGEHTEAVDLLRGAGDDGRQAARQLSQLLRYKTPAQYDPAPMPEGDARKAVELARRLVDRAAQVGARRRPPG